MKTLRFILLFLSTIVLGQSKDSISNKYLDDQLYIGITYNTLQKTPPGINQNGFSNGLSVGFIKDMPINIQRNVGFGLGLGYGRNTYYQNLKIYEENNSTVFEEVSGSFKRNKFSFHSLEVPIEFRWRTSTVDKYKFWRIYTGLKLGYIFASNAKLKQNGTTKIKGISELNKFQYGWTLGAGFGTWNLNVYYGLSDLFSDAQLKDTTNSVELRDLRIGLIFYIL
tara:strand:- start:72486 stop:73157 length:672 start_codon:yes stop_codon:yes gene_type:complete